MGPGQIDLPDRGPCRSARPSARRVRRIPPSGAVPTVLDVAAPDPAGASASQICRKAWLSPEKLGRTLREPDPSWMTRLTDEWRPALRPLKTR